MTDRDESALRLMEMIDRATDSTLSPPADGMLPVEEAYLADPEFARITDLRLRQAHVGALGAIALLLLRKDEQMWQSWKVY